MRRNVIRHWDERARKFGEYPKATGWGGHLRWVEKRQIMKYAPKKGLILDLGCGNGYVLGYLFGEGKFLVGLDLSAEMVKMAKERLGGSSEIIRGDAAQLPFKNECFEYIYSIRTLVNMISAGNQSRAMKELARVLKRGRRLVLIECLVEGINNLNRLRNDLGIPHLKIEWYNRFFKEEEMRSMLRENQLTVIRTMWLPIISVLEKVVFPKFRRIRGATRLFQALYYLSYLADRELYRFFPLLGYDFVFACAKESK